MVVWREYNLVSIECLMRYYIQFLLILQHMDTRSAAQDSRSLTVLCLFFSFRLQMMVEPSKTIQFGSYATFGHDA